MVSGAEVNRAPLVTGSALVLELSLPPSWSLSPPISPFLSSGSFIEGHCSNPPFTGLNGSQDRIFQKDWFPEAEGSFLGFAR